jgi:hypothetical protein
MPQIAVRLIAASLALWPLPGFAETESELRGRLQDARERDHKEALRREESMRLRYEMNWKQYGDYLEVRITSWQRQQDGTWITDGKSADVDSDRGRLAKIAFESGAISRNEFCQMANCWTPVLISVNCKSLHVRKQYQRQAWRSWARPASGSPEEQLLVDRCVK